MINEKELDTIHKCMYNKLKQESDRENKIEKKKVTIILGRFYHVPKEERNNIIKDLENKGIIKVINRFEIEIN